MKENIKTLKYYFNYLHEGFEQTATALPNNIAIIYKKYATTYRELNIKAEKLKCYLLNQGINQGDIVAICGEKNLESIVGILGVLKCGAAYVPIDISFPKNRIDYMLKNIEVSNVLITNSNVLSDINYLNYNVHNIKDILCKNFNQGDFIQPGINKNELAYILYTSGSTGKPNGVMVTHQNICNTLNWRTNYYDCTPDDSVLQFSSLSFDSSVEDIFCALSTGAKVILPEDKYKLNVDYIRNLINNNNITHFMIVPSFYKILLSMIPEALKLLKNVVLAGENFDNTLIKQHYDSCPNVALYNEYGPTENSVCSTCAYLDKDDMVNIGKQIDNVYYYILDDSGNEIEKYKEGELALGGLGITKGYINNAQLTDERFIRDHNNPEKLIYKTGDIIVKDNNGNLRFLRRKDNEIKIRGMRVDLGEIESSTFNFSSKIIDAVTVACDIGNDIKSINLFFTSKEIINVDCLKEFLAENIPAYMLPNSIIQIDTFPLLLSGKIDYQTLKSTIGNNISKPYSTNANGEFKKLLSIVSRHSDNQSFSEDMYETDVRKIGINSLEFIKLLSDIETEFNLELDFDDLDNVEVFSITNLYGLISNKINDNNKKEE